MKNIDKNPDNKTSPPGYWAGILFYTLAWFSILSSIFPIPLIGPSIAEAVKGTTTLTVTATVAFSAASSSGLESVTPANLAVTLSAASGQTVAGAYTGSGGAAAGG